MYPHISLSRSEPGLTAVLLDVLWWQHAGWHSITMSLTPVLYILYNHTALLMPRCCCAFTSVAIWRGSLHMACD